MRAKSKPEPFDFLPAVLLLLDPAGRRKIWYDILMRYLFIPFNIIFNISKVVIAYKQAEHAKFDGYHIAKIAIEVLALIVSMAAVMMALTGISFFFVSGPVIYTSMLAVRTIFSFGSAIHFFYKAAKTEDLSEKSALKLKVKDSLIDAAMGTAAVLILTSLLVFAAPLMELASIVLGLIACIVASVVLISRFTHLPPLNVPVDYNDNELSNNAELASVLGLKPAVHDKTEQPESAVARKISTLPGHIPQIDKDNDYDTGTYEIRRF